MAVLESIYNSIAGNIDSLVTGKYSAIVEIVQGPLQVGLAINLIVCGYAIMRGISNEPWGAYLATWFKAYLVIVAATSNFGPWAATLAQDLPDQLVAALGGTNIAGQFDAFVQSTSSAAFSLVSKSKPLIDKLPLLGIPLPDLYAYLLYFVILIVAYLAAAIALVLALFVKFGLAVTVAVGPIFVGLLMFSSTSGFFSSWLSAVLNYAIQGAALALSFTFVSGTVWAFAAKISATGDARIAIYLALILQLVIVLVGGFLILQTSAIANALAGGGGGASGTQFVSSVLPSPGAAGRFATGAARLGARVAASAARLGARGLRAGSSAAASGARAAARSASGGISRLRGASSRSA